MNKKNEDIYSPSKKILVFDLLTNLAWILSSILTNRIVGSSGNIMNILSTKAFAVIMITSIFNPLILPVRKMRAVFHKRLVFWKIVFPSYCRISTREAP